MPWPVDEEATVPKQGATPKVAPAPGIVVNNNYPDGGQASRGRGGRGNRGNRGKKRQAKAQANVAPAHTIQGMPIAKPASEAGDDLNE